MAIAVIGGLLVSTLLSLLFVPAFFMVMDDIGRVFHWLLGRFIGPRDEVVHTADPLKHAPAPVPAE
jgi:HAE1 family hydrophobic/amphiphilic exporter-1